MNNFIVRYKIITNRGGGYVAGNFVSVFWDDVADTTVVIRYNDALDNVGTVEASGPDLGADRYDYVPVSPVRGSSLPYKFCDGTTLNTFNQRSTYPYVNRTEIPNHFSCSIPVCDIRITGATSTNATDTDTADGSITVSADTSAPDVRYSLDPEFAGGGQLSGQFTGLLAGTYVVFAKDARGCSVNTTVIVGTPTTYGPKYRLEYYDRNHNKSRTDILERGYTGDVIDLLEFGPDPVVIAYNGDGDINRFTPVIPSQLTLTLLSPSNFYFRELFSQDERKYKIEYSKDFGVIQEAEQNLPDLDDYTNDTGGGVFPTLWTLGPAPEVTLTTEGSSAWLRDDSIVWHPGLYAIDYDIDVSLHIPTIRFQIYDTGGAVGTLNFTPALGSNVGTLFLNCTGEARVIRIRVIQQIVPLPILSTWEQRAEENRQPWATGIPEPVVVLLKEKISQSLYCHYDFVEGKSYTIAITIDKDVHGSSTGASTLYYAGRNESFFAIYSPFGEFFDGGSGTYVESVTFTAPANMTIFSFQIYHRSTAADGFVIYEIESVEITDSDDLGTTVKINQLSSDTPEISGLQLKWTGFVISQIYSEPYDAPKNYPVTVVATDGLADLDKYDFSDQYGNKFQSDIVTLDAIANILRKTDLGINIVTAVNRLEVSMTTNALTESMINPAMFYEEGGDITDCFEALEQLVKSFAVRIFQRNAKWIIQTVEEAVHEFQAMEFNASGEFIQNLQIQDIIAITGPIGAMEAAFKSRDQYLEVVPSYGVMTFEHTLIQNPSLVKSYSFEEEDISITPDGVIAFKNWNVNIENAPGAEYGIKETKSFEGDYNFYYKVPVIPYAEPGYTVVVTSAEGLIEYEAVDLFEFKFDYATITGKVADRVSASGTPLPGSRAHYPFWVRLKWSLRIGSYYFDDIRGDWTTTKKYNDIYVDTFNDPQNFKIVGPMRSVTSLTLESFQVEFVLFDESVVDFIVDDDDFTEFDAIPTVDLSIGYRVKGKVIYTAPLSETVTYMYYELAAEDTETNGYESRRPSDYDEDDNPVVWIRQEESVVRRSGPRANYLSNRPSREIPITYQYLDNVVLRSLPGGTEPPDNISLVRNNNLNIKIDFSDQFLLNDIDIENINNSERIYKNYLKKLDGTPTQLWERTYRSGQGKLLELYSADFLSQYNAPTNKLTGSMLLAEEVTFSTVMRELFDNNKLYMFMGMELHDREYSVIFDMLELKDVVNDDTSEAIDAGFTSGFTLGFRA